jgi:competence protein ComEA
MLEVVKKIGLSCLLVLLGGLVYFFRLERPVETLEDVDKKETVVQNDIRAVPVVRVHVAGAVVNPGVYEIPVGMTVMEAIAYSGGLAPDANLDKVNLAKMVGSGQRVFVPFLKETQARSRSSKSARILVQPIAINQVNRTELETIPGIGRKMAQEIIAYRQRHGRFQSEQELLQVKYIGKRMLEKIKPYITFD